MSSRMILLIEDNQKSREIYKGYLESNGFSEVDCAGSYDDAMARLEEGVYDLLISDIILNDQNPDSEKTGLDILRHIKVAHVKKIPVVLLTGYESSEFSLDLLRSESVAVLEKPITSDDLISAVRDALNNWDEQSGQEMEKEIFLCLI